MSDQVRSLITPSVEGSRRQLLEAVRQRIAEEIDSGAVASHALARLVAELSKTDAELRKEIEAEGTRSDRVHDATFDPSSV